MESSTSQDYRGEQPPVNMLQAALDYVELGIPVHPLMRIVWRGDQLVCACSKGAICTRPGKHPLLEHGVHDASAVEGVVAAWWRVHQGANIGLAMGGKGRRVAVDYDGPEGRATRERLITEHGMPRTPIQRTGSGGFHEIYEIPDGLTVANRVRVPALPGVDLRGDGGYIVGAPSLHVSGERYRWLTGHGIGMDVAPMPEWLLEALRAPAPSRLHSVPREATPPAANRQQAAAAVPGETWPHAYLQAELASTAHVMIGAAPGSRERAVYDAAFSVGGLIPRGLDRAEAERVLAAAACGAWPDCASGRTIPNAVRNGLDRGQLRPREHLPREWCVRAVVEVVEEPHVETEVPPHAAAAACGVGGGDQAQSAESSDADGVNGAARSDDADPRADEDVPPPTDADAPRSANGAAQKSDAWPAPQELPTLPPVPTWDERLLPPALRPWLSDVIERTQCPAEYVAVGAIVSLASVIGRQCAIRPKRHDDWTIVPNLWGATVGPPSAMKSPALQEAMRPLRHLARAASQAHIKLQTKREELDAQLDAAKKALRKAAGANECTEELRAKYEALRSELAAANVERRYIVHDSTTEKLGEILNANCNGVLLFRDELVGWLASLERQGHESDRAFYLEAWNGTGEFVYDRIGRGTVRIEAACVSLLGGIQPGPLGRYLQDAISGGAGADGLMQRFQLLVYPDPPRDWKNVDRWPDSDARRKAIELFERMSALGGIEDLGTRKRVDGELPYFRFDVDAQKKFDAWHGALMLRARKGNDHDAIVGHLMKYASLMPTLALVFELAAGGTDFVRLPAAELAVEWCTMLEAHARRVYASVTGGEIAAARALLAKIRAGKLPDTFGARDVYRAQWSGLTDVETVERALEVLDAYDWVRVEAVRTAGRPKLVATVNPATKRSTP